MDSPALFCRHPENPILHPGNMPFEASLVFNPGVVRFNGRYLMVFRYEYGSFDGKLLEHTKLGKAWSDDGVHRDVEGDAVVVLDDPDDLRVYDPRLTVLEDRLYLNFAADTRHGIRAGLAVADGGLAFHVLDMTTPDNRNHVLSPGKIGGFFWRLERPFPVYGRGGQEHFDIWISRSPDLLHWGGARLLISVEDVPWANAKIGPGSPPSISSDPVLEPIAHYETGGGFRTNVVFPSAAILESDGLIKLYYGASDTSVCLAEADSRDILDYLAYCRVTLPGGL